MRSFTIFWKFFRVICIVQLILVAFKGIFSLSQLFDNGSIWVPLVNIAAYTLVFLFVYHGLSMLNYNYPDVPLSLKQKRSFNILYLINFILISFLFAEVVNTRWMVPFIVNAEFVKKYWFMLTSQLAFPWLIFIIHLVVLVGMFWLRKTIYQNTISTWYEQFDKKS